MSKGRLRTQSKTVMAVCYQLDYNMYHNTAEAKEYGLKSNLLKKLEDLKEDLNKSLKEI